jgi:hypothetical protein
MLSCLLCYGTHSSVYCGAQNIHRFVVTNAYLDLLPCGHVFSGPLSCRYMWHCQTLRLHKIGGLFIVLDMTVIYSDFYFSIPRSKWNLY